MSEPGALKRLFGDTIELSGEGDVYHIKAELAVNGKTYAILQSKEMEREGEIEVFRIAFGSGEEDDVQLETVEDDDEWEAVSEAYDDMQFGSDDQP
ncbi:DUF1292 domain-containing protein [Cohnella sp. GCM10027633]|uniref:DUF1292 domain-containing protein n=1 Tax=unclassified Cohnella TaxID=2636738 RepID=UPI00363A75C7